MKKTLSTITLATLVLLAAVGAAHAQVPFAERQALVALYESTGGPTWQDSTGWLGEPGTECAWNGVGCSPEGFVIELELNHNDLTGPLPGQLADLVELRHLRLPGNRLSGPIPKELGKLSKLYTIFLHDNLLDGPIPPELGALAELRELFLGRNKLSGPVPEALAELHNLEVLRLESNALSGAVPDRILALPKLAILRFEDNNGSQTALKASD